MKKITLAAILIFLGILGYVYYGDIMYGPKYAPITVTAINPPIISNEIKGIKSKTNTSNANSNLKDSGKILLTPNEVAKHSSSSDCYLIINNIAYDVTSYIGYHPGGSRTITSRCGHEVTGVFASIHSNFAWNLLSKYKVGALAKTNNTISNSNNINLTLQSIKEGLKTSNPNAEIISVKPKSNFYISKIIYNGKLFEVHIDKNGKIIKEEVQDSENDWSQWNKDADDD